MNAMHSSLPYRTVTNRTRFSIQKTLAGKKIGLQALFSLAGPAVVASVAYIDPGNFATNIQAGAKYGYGLLWVVVFANLIAMLFQGLSAKLGIVTDQSLPELCRTHFPKPVTLAMWVVSEISAIATDLAEFLGGALGLSLLFHMPLMMGMVITALITFAILHLGRAGFRPLELAIFALVGVIGLSYLFEVWIAPINWPSVAFHAVVPHIENSGALMLVAGIVGATVMPHAIYLHSGLMQGRAPLNNNQDRKKMLNFSNWEVIIALSAAGAINIAMVLMAASAFHHSHAHIADIQTAYQTLIPLLGSAAAVVFLVSLIAAGVSSSAVGTMAGQMIMQGFVHFHIPVWVRRAVTIVPAFIIIALGIDPTKALIMSQVVLSITLPLPMIALVIFTSRADIMGQFTNTLKTKIIAIIGTVVILLLNLFLLIQALHWI